MYLKEYLFYNNIKKADFAKEIGVSRWHIYSVFVGRRTFGEDVCKKIEKRTKGMVSYDEARATGKDQKHRKKKKGDR
jgi:hypothetical protein